MLWGWRLWFSHSTMLWEWRTFYSPALWGGMLVFRRMGGWILWKNICKWRRWPSLGDFRWLVDNCIILKSSLWAIEYVCLLLIVKRQADSLCITISINVVRSKLQAYAKRPKGGMGRGRGLPHALNTYEYHGMANVTLYKFSLFLVTWKQSIFSRTFGKPLRIKAR